MQPAEMRPLGVGETLDAAVKVYRSAFGPLLLRALGVVLPLEALAWMVGIAGSRDLTVREGGIGGRELVGDAAPTYAVVLVVVSVAAIVGVLVAGSRTALGSALGGAERFPRPRPGASFVIAVLTCGAMAAGLLVVGLGLVWAFLAFMLAASVAAAEGAGAGRALGRSFQLVHRRFFPLLGAALATYGLVWVLENALTTPVQWLFVVGKLDDAAAYVTATALLRTIVRVLVLPLWPALAAVAYLDLRMRSEGLDLQLALAAPTTAAPSFLSADQAAASSHS